MKTIYCNQQKQAQSSKLKTNTPATADSDEFLKLEEKLPQAYHVVNEHWSFWANSTLFEKSSAQFLDDVQKIDSTIKLKAENNMIVQQTIHNSDIEVSLAILNKTSGDTRMFEKRICQTIQTKEFITLIFDRQFEKLQFRKQNEYKIELYLKTKDQFHRKIWEQEIKEPSFDKSGDIMVLQDKERGFKLNSEFQEILNSSIKPLCLTVPLKIIDNFYKEKFQLLNKSDLLNTIQDAFLLQGILFPLTKENMGSRIIQKLLQRSSFDQILMIMSELKPYISQMAVDKYGNYVLQKIFKVGNLDMRKICLETLQKDLVKLLKTKAGTHCLQEILLGLYPQEIQKIITIIESELIELCHNQFAHHFLQKLIKIYPSETLVLLLLESVQIIASNRYGIVVIKKLLKFSSQNQYFRQEFLNKITLNFNDLAFEEYGHYIIVEMYKYYSFYELQNLLEHMRIYIKVLSSNQYSSSILHKGIEQFEDYASIPMITQLIQNGVEGLMQTPTGSFVLHRLMDHTNNEQYFNYLTKTMIDASPSLCNYEKRYKWMKFFNLV